MARRVAGSAFVFFLLWAISIPAEPLVRICPFHWLTGIPCPLCGLTRGLFAFAKGHWTEAVHFNALTPLASGMLFSLPWNGPWQKPLWIGGLASFAVYGVYRVAAA